MRRPLLLDLGNSDRKALVDETDRLIVASKTFYVGTNGYVYFSVWSDGASRPETLHSLIIGPTPGRHIDHRNRDKLDNRRENLRVATYQQNQVNRAPKPNRGLSYGPRFSATKPWRAQIMVNRRQLHLGCFATREEALEARISAEIRYYGEACPR